MPSQGRSPATGRQTNLLPSVGLDAAWQLKTQALEPTPGFQSLLLCNPEYMI